MLAMLVDAADKGSNGQGIAQHWAQTIVRAALSGHQPPDITSITQLMREQQRELRHHYLHEIASYCCVLIDLQSRQLHILQTGDCLVSTQQANGRIAGQVQREIGNLSEPSHSTQSGRARD